MIADGILVERARRQDELAFAALVERYKTIVVAYLVRLVGCQARAEDLAQDTFIRFYERLDRYEERGKLGSFLLRLATRLFLSEERRRKRRALLSLRVLAPSETSADSIVEWTYQGQVRSALLEVPAHYRAPLLLYVIEGLSYQEIADILGVRVGTIKSRIARARLQLKTRLSTPDQEEDHARLVAR